MKHKRIAIISDIHANIEILNSFLKYIETEKIDTIFNLGDFISEGSHPKEVFDIVINHKKFVNIMGYDEENLFNIVGENKEKSLELKGLLGDERIKKLKELPRFREVSIANKHFLLVHNNGANFMTQKATYAKEIKDNTYDYIFYGGSHKQELIHNKPPFYRNNIIDPGALTSPQDELGYFVVMELDENNINISFKTLKLQIANPIQSRPQDELLVHIFQEKKNTKGEYILVQEILQKVLEMGIKENKYVSIGCWDHEKTLIKEVLWHLKCRTFKKCVFSGQEWYTGEITKEVIELLLEKNKDKRGRFKWLEVSFQNSLEDRKSTYGIYHYGSECLLRCVSKEELKVVKEFITKHKANYTVENKSLKK